MEYALYKAVDFEETESTPASLEALKIIAESWTHKQWEDYLLTVDSGLKESHVCSYDQIDELDSSDYVEQIFSVSKEESSPKFEAIKKSLRSLTVHHLSKREHQVIWCRFWDSLNTTETAEKLKISRSSVRTLERRAS